DEHPQLSVKESICEFAGDVGQQISRIARREIDDRGSALRAAHTNVAARGEGMTRTQHYVERIHGEIDGGRDHGLRSTRMLSKTAAPADSRRFVVPALSAI